MEQQIKEELEKVYKYIGIEVNFIDFRNYKIIICTDKMEEIDSFVYNYNVNYTLEFNISIIIDIIDKIIIKLFKKGEENGEENGER